MSKRALIAATAIVSTTFSPIAMTPAFADDGDGVILLSVSLEGDYDPQEICEEALRPNANSGFQTEPLNVSDTGWANDGAPVRDQNVGDPVPTGTPSASNVFVEGSYNRNGGSPNVWARAQATLTYPNSTQEYTTVQNLKRTVTVDCYVWKVNNGGHTVVPPGLQTTGNTAIQTDQTAGPNGFDTNAGPITQYGQEVNALVCISPGKKGGSWRGKHGFDTDQCQAASDAANQWIPSGNIPQI